MEVKKSILFSLPFSPAEMGAGPRNFSNFFCYLQPLFIRNGYNIILCPFLKSNQTPEQVIADLQKISYFTGCTIIPIKRTFPSLKFVYQILELIASVLKFRRILKLYDPSTVYAFGERNAFFASIWKKKSTFKLILDIRGNLISEYKELGVPGWKLNLIRGNMRFSIKASDMVFSVATGLDFSLPANRISFKYNYYDGAFFHYSPDEALIARKNLGLENRFVFLYNGSDHHYQNIEFMISFFSGFHKRYPDSFFMILTEYPEESFTRLLSEYQVPSTCWLIKKLKQSEINYYQLAANAAFLIRDDLPLNHYSFPTKFSEYMGSGVPVITTPFIHTISPWIQKYGLGEIIEVSDDLNSFYDHIYSLYNNNPEIRLGCARFAEKELKWQNKAPEIFEIIDRVNNSTEQHVNHQVIRVH
jgi:glycosyltransferase involved in cell wall biosynthesis